MKEPIKVAVIYEWHPFDVIHFQEMLSGLDGVVAYPQPWDIFVQDPSREEYDAILFYNMSFPVPPANDLRRKYVEEELGRSGQGIILLHHAVLSYEGWPVWDAISGTSDRSFTYHQGEHLTTQISASVHPITRGLEDFEITDETYLMAEPSDDCVVLATTEHPKSVGAIAWVREYRNSRVFCYVSGHDNEAWRNPTFRTMVHRGIAWTSHRIDQAPA